MGIGRDAWLAARAASRAAPSGTITEARILMNRDGSATVELLGTDLWSPGMLPDVTVGGIPVTAIRLGAAGELNGKLARRPRNDEVIVSIGSRGIHGRAVIVATPGRAGGPIWDRLGTLLAFLWSHLRLPRH